ncbi:MAG: asparagine synthase (glutamine-hydrolyzing) [Melioribacteraceae bacterium]|nr:asparagine synthase (glutamine-hydrolyzing) [Melioribacteraceae bacterium]MCF8262863.1 asparagine synthase (glutamine-hydrolyzing) [Melioribacteraceae bacterium]MCF8430654.1 asparagine synthase (glutamine-hydrolyzing) [Melioribacteraceae bacterium]
MCGINGIFSNHPESDKREILKRMNDRLAHRGPDDAGIFVQNQIGLGHRRLSIIDTSKAGHQPMVSENGRYTITYNGEIYNFKNLRNELADYNFITNCDTEVILAAFKIWGENCLSRFNGMFAFAIWDNVTNSLFIARDRLGIKPFYYYYENGMFVFSSEIRSLLASDCVPKKLSHSCLPEYLQYQTIHSPNTIIENIRMLEAGSYMTLASGELEIHKYWEPINYVDSSKFSATYDDCKLEVRNKLYESVERRMVADVPFGAFLSGGIDSSIVVALMSKISQNKVKTFSINFEYEEFSEAQYSREISKLYGTEHNEITISADDIIQNIGHAISQIDHPTGDAINNFIISEKTKNAGITMALSGLGGDELFAGYDYFRQNLILHKYSAITSIPTFLRSMMGNTLCKIKPSIQTAKIRNLLKLEKWELENTYPVSREVYFQEELSELFRELGPNQNIVHEIIKSISVNKKWDNTNLLISKISVSEISTYLQNILLRDTDQMSMASALEVRVPFLDHELVEYVLSIPDEFKYPHSPKKLLVDATADLIPPGIVNRPKMGFLFPWSIWMKNDLKSFCENSLNELKLLNIFHESALDSLWNRFLNNDPMVNWARIWMLIVLQKWIQENDIVV